MIVTPYTLVHLVAGETTKDLIVPQVVRHMIAHAETDGPFRPSHVVVVFLEPARLALRRSVRTRLREIRAGANSVQVIFAPFVSRFNERQNAAVLGRLLRWRVGGLPIVFHCRGESAVSWAAELRKYFSGCGIVADIRGAWPEELLFERGFNGYDEADELSRRDYDQAVDRVRSAVSLAGAVLSVSPDMLDWLRSVGAESDKLTYVPCCVSQSRFSAHDRQRIRKALGFDDRIVLAYLGTISRYQHIEDGVVPFFRAVAGECASAHLLCLTNDSTSMQAALSRGGISPDRATILHLAHGDVAAHLCAADAGLLLRAPSRLNGFSRPTKLGEYLASGLPVILSRGMGQTDSLIEHARAGVIVDAFARDEGLLRQEAARVVTALRQDGNLMRLNALRLAEDHFLWRVHLAPVRAAYAKALHK